MSTSPPESACPYKGPAAFDSADAGWFFGRSSLVDQMVSRLRENRTLVVAGPPRCGKSSLVRAGLLPALAGGALPGSDKWPQSVFVPGRHPLDVLWSALGEVAGKPLPDIFSLQEAPGRVAARSIERGVLVIDQFEELFKASDQAERGAFLSVLEALEGEGPAELRLVFCVGTDLYTRCAAITWLASVISENHILVGPMSRDELKEAIDAPAHRAGLRLEEGLADRILDDLGDDRSSPQRVSEALREMWNGRNGRFLTHQSYERTLARPLTPGPGPAREPAQSAASDGPRSLPDPIRAEPHRAGRMPPVLVALAVLAVAASLALGILLTEMAH